MNCGKYLELLSARLDGALRGSEERELETHLESCPACRAAAAQLAALRTAFAELEELPAPEGFAQGVMDRIRAANKTVPLFRRPRFKALAGLAACAALAVGLYSAVRHPQQDWDQMTRSYHQDALEKVEDISAGEMLRSVPDFSTTTASPDADTPAGGTEEHLFFESQQQEIVPEEYEAAVCDSADAVSNAPMSDTEILVVDRMPEGGWELIPPEAPVSADGLHVTGELLEQISQMAREQGITVSITSGTEESVLHLIVVLGETK